MLSRTDRPRVRRVDKLTDAQRITFLREVERDPALQSLAARRLEEKKKVSADAVLRLMGTPEEMF